MPAKDSPHKPSYITRLDQVPELSAGERRRLGPVSDKYVFRTNDYYQSLIDWDDPARSPLLQMALNRSDSLTPHPDVGSGPGSRGWRPVFRSTEDRRFQLAVEWIRSMYRPRPEYPIDYQPPLPSGAKPLGEEQAPPVER